MILVPLHISGGGAHCCYVWAAVAIQIHDDHAGSSHFRIEQLSFTINPGTFLVRFPDVRRR
jgi:hypothetical protein